MRHEEVKVGMRVMLTHPKKSYTLGRSNPAVGTPWQIGGMVSDIYFGDSIGVVWDNGKRNEYKSSDLSSEEEEVIGVTGRCVSIW